MGAGAALLRQVFVDGGSDLRTFLVTAPTVSAEPFYLKHGMERVPDEELETWRPEGLALPGRFCIMRWTPQAMR